MAWYSKNQGIDPQDPAFDRDYDADADYDAYERACEERADMERDERW